MDISTILTEAGSFLGGGLTGAIGALYMMKATKKGKEIENEGHSLENVSKIIEEYQEYIAALKQDRAEALRERDEYKAQVQQLWTEVNELKSKLARVEGQLQYKRVVEGAPQISTSSDNE